MSPALSLPPELLLHIFTLSVNYLPAQYRWDFCDRKRTLRSLALVHSSWTGPAQLVQRKEVWLTINPDKRRSWSFFHRDLGGPQYLTIWGYFEIFLEITEVDIWTKVVYLAFAIDDSMALEQFACFPSKPTLPLTPYAHIDNASVSIYISDLRTLHIETDEYTVGDFDEHLRFDNLQRLLLTARPAEDSASSSTIGFITPERMPQLAHLAWDYSDQSRGGAATKLDAILPHLETLSLRCYDYDETIAASLPSLDRLPNLQHLAVDIQLHEQALLELFPKSAKINLRSLHLSTYQLSNLPGFSNRLKDLLGTNGKEEIALDRVVLYGNPLAPVSRQLTSVEWRTLSGKPLFEYFDGK